MPAASKPAPPAAIADLVVVGAGPAGSACAAFAALAGLEVALVDREHFPRHKVCGDCLNPSSWSLFDELGLSDALLACDHVALARVRLESRAGRAVTVPLPPPPRGEIAVKREILDQLLLERARAGGARVHTGTTVTGVTRDEAGVWRIATSSPGVELRARILVAADGRNSTVAGLLGIADRRPPRRVAFQTHLPLPDRLRDTVLLKVLPTGYCGANPVNDRELNLCLVSNRDRIDDIKAWAQKTFEVPPDQKWHSVTPLARDDRDPAPRDGLFLVGDAARVVEPFTGEGIYYGLRSGQLAAAAIAAMLVENAAPEAALRAFRKEYHALYRDRLWVNRLTRLAVTRPGIGDAMVAAGKCVPALLPWLTAKVVKA